jgi:glycosyltransferase involved in cell wall biosynthesis
MSRVGGAALRFSGIVHTRDSGATVEVALRSLAWVDELVVVDMASRDATVEIARRFATRVESVAVAPRVDGIRNEHLERLTGDWVFVLDADESLADDAAEEVRALVARHGERYDAFAIPRFDSIAGRTMRGSGWYPDHQIRLFRKGTVRWRDTVHDLPAVVTGRHRLLELVPPDCLHIHHRNYESLRHFVRKQVEYALDDRYDDRPESFELADYVARAYEALALRDEPEVDGDLSHALALLLAWDQIVRGLVHWDSLQPRPPLALLSALPIATERVPWWRIRIRRWLGRRHSFGYYARRAQDVLRLR